MQLIEMIANLFLYLSDQNLQLRVSQSIVLIHRVELIDYQKYQRNKMSKTVSALQIIQSEVSVVVYSYALVLFSLLH